MFAGFSAARLPVLAARSPSTRIRWHRWGSHPRSSSTSTNSMQATPRPTSSVKSDPVTLRRLLAVVRPEASLLAIGGVALFVSAGVTMAVPAGLGAVLDIAMGSATGASNALQGTFMENWSFPSIVASVSAVLLFGAASNALRVFMFSKAAANVQRQGRMDMFVALMSSRPIAYFETSKSGDLLSRIQNDVWQMSEAVAGETLSGVVRNSVQTCVSLGAMLWLSPKLTGVMGIITPLIGLTAWCYGRFVKTITYDMQNAEGDAMGMAEERLSNIRMVKSFDRDQYEVEKFRGELDKVYSLSIDAAKASALFFGASGLLGNLSILTVLGLGANMVAASEISAGTLTSFLLYTVYMSVSIAGLSSNYSSVMLGIGSSRRVFEVLDDQPTSLHGRILDMPSGKLEFKNVTFAYPGRPDAPVLRDLSFNVPAGQVVGVCGPSGSGKSTLTNLLLRFFDPQTGSITLDGHDYKSLDAHWVRRHVGIVSQEPTLFAGTIRENILYGNLDASEEDVERCARMANAHHFIVSFPAGYDTRVGQRGVSLSGGQKQRIAIARALIKDPKVLILDEASSALDSASEKLVQEALEVLMRNRTSLVIAHRLSTIRKVDSIVVLDNGKAVEQGSHDELMERRSVYYNMVQSQRMEV